MPLWQIYHHPGIYTEEQKQRFAADITQLYHRVGLPKFYVVTLFHQVDPSSFLIGAEPTDAAVRIAIAHIARRSEDPIRRQQTREAIGRLIAPHTIERGLYCEFHIDETPRDLWMINGMSPPAPNSDAERLWAEKNYPVPY